MYFESVRGEFVTLLLAVLACSLSACSRAPSPPKNDLRTSVEQMRPAVLAPDDLPLGDVERPPACVTIDPATNDEFLTCVGKALAKAGVRPSTNAPQSGVGTTLGQAFLN